MPHFANDFRSVRRQLELLPSRVLPNGEIGPPPPPYSSKRGCSCHCTCGADEHAAAHAPGAPETPELPELRELRELREFNELQVLHEVLAGPVGPGPAPEYPFPGAGASTSSSMSSMSTLNVLSSSASSDALNMHLAPRGPRTRPVSLAGLRPYPRFRVGSSASASSVNLATVV
jgi:hypothetical protein